MGDAIESGIVLEARTHGTSSCPQYNHILGDFDLIIGVDIDEVLCQVGVLAHLVTHIHGKDNRVFLSLGPQPDNVRNHQPKDNRGGEAEQSHAPSSGVQRMVKANSKERVGVVEVLVPVLPKGVTGQVVGPLRQSLDELLIFGTQVLGYLGFIVEDVFISSLGDGELLLGWSRCRSTAASAGVGARRRQIRLGVRVASSKHVDWKDISDRASPSMYR